MNKYIITEEVKTELQEISSLLFILTETVFGTAYQGGSFIIGQLLSNVY
jgi:hypothetical protein